MDLEPQLHETLDCILGGNIHLIQARRGYRTAIDAPLLAWFAAQQAPEARVAVELGAGSGLVAIVLARALPQLHLHLLEKQPQMADRAARNGRLNGVASRLTVQLSDILASPPLPRDVDLVLCNPPYLRRDHGHPPGNPERHIAHQETTATLGQFCQVAAQAMGSTSRSCWVFPFHDAPRLLDALATAGLGARAVMHVRHRPNDVKPNRVLVCARWGVASLEQLPDRAIHLQDQPDRVFQADLAAFFASLALP